MAGFPPVVIRRNLENFSLVFGKLTPERQKELVALLVQEVSYSQQDQKIKLTLRPLPDLDLRVEGHKISFDERTDWLPGGYFGRGKHHF